MGFQKTLVVGSRLVIYLEISSLCSASRTVPDHLTFDRAPKIFRCGKQETRMGVKRLLGCQHQTASSTLSNSGCSTRDYRYAFPRAGVWPKFRLTHLSHPHTEVNESVTHEMIGLTVTFSMKMGVPHATAISSMI